MIQKEKISKDAKRRRSSEAEQEGALVAKARPRLTSSLWPTLQTGV